MEKELQLRHSGDTRATNFGDAVLGATVQCICLKNLSCKERS